MLQWVGHRLVMCVGDGLAMDEAWSCNGLNFLFKTISSWVGHCVVMGGTLSCLVWGTVLVMGVNSLPMGGTLCCNGWDIVLLCVCGDIVHVMGGTWSCNGLGVFQTAS